MARNYPQGCRWLARVLAAALLIAAPGPGAIEALAAVRIAASVGKAPIGGAAAGAALRAPVLNSNPVLAELTLSPRLALPSSGLRLNLESTELSRVSAISALSANPASMQTVVSAGTRSAQRAVSTAEEPAAAGSLKEQRQAFAAAVKRSSKKGLTGAQAKSQFDQLFEGADFTGSPRVAAKAPAAKRRRLLRGALVSVGAAAAVGVPAVALADIGAGAAGATPILPGLAGILNLASWSPASLVVGAALLPFVLYLVPAFFKALRNRRAAVMRRVVRQVRSKPSRIEKDGNYRRYVLERKRRIRNGGTFTDRFIVRVPAGAGGRRSGAELRTRVIIESEMLRPAKGGHRVKELLQFKYTLKGKPISYGSFVRSALYPDGRKRELSSRFFSENKRAARKVLSRWAPDESGKLRLLLFGAVASLPAFLLAGAAVHPLDTFMGMAAGALTGIGMRYLFKSIKIRKLFGRWIGLVTVMAATVGVGAAIYFFQVPVMGGYLVSLAASLILSLRYWPDTELRLPDGPARADLRRSGSAFGKTKYALIALLAFASLAHILNPSPAGARERAMMAEKMEVGETGAEYAQYLRDHPEVAIYLVKPWHNEDMSDAIGRHHDAVPSVSRAKIMLNAEAYGIRSESWVDFELSLSTLVHELDHDKQEEDTGGVPTTLSHEHSAWDHQARFILEQFAKNPELFKPGDENDDRKYLMLRRAQRWLNDGPVSYRSYVSGFYPKNPKIEDFKGERAEAWKTYYKQRRAEMQSAWEARKDDSELKVKLGRAVTELRAAGAASMDAPELRPGTGTLLGAFFGGLLSLLSLLGIERLIPVLRRRRRARKS